MYICQFFKQYCNNNVHFDEASCKAIMANYYRTKKGPEAYICNGCPTIFVGSFGEFYVLHREHLQDFGRTRPKKYLSSNCPVTYANGPSTSGRAAQEEERIRQERLNQERLKNEEQQREDKERRERIRRETQRTREEQIAEEEARQDRERKRKDREERMWNEKIAEDERRDNERLNKEREEKEKNKRRLEKEEEDRKKQEKKESDERFSDWDRRRRRIFVNGAYEAWRDEHVRFLEKMDEIEEMVDPPMSEMDLKIEKLMQEREMKFFTKYGVIVSIVVDNCMVINFEMQRLDIIQMSSLCIAEVTALNLSTSVIIQHNVADTLSIFNFEMQRLEITNVPSICIAEVATNQLLSPIKFINDCLCDSEDDEEYIVNISPKQWKEANERAAIRNLFPKFSARDRISVNRLAEITDNVIDSILLLKWKISFKDINMHIFNTTFSTLLFSSNKVGLSWTRKIDIFEFDFLVIPSLVNGHYFLVIVENPWMIECITADSHYHQKIVSFRNKNHCSPRAMIYLFNSLVQNHDSERIIKVRAFIQEEWDLKKSMKLGKRVCDNSSLPNLIPTMVKQTNIVDCGLFLFNYFTYFFEKRPRNYNLKYLMKWFAKCKPPHEKMREKLDNVLCYWSMGWKKLKK